MTIIRTQDTVLPSRYITSGPFGSQFTQLPDGRTEVKLTVGGEPSIFEHLPFASLVEAQFWVKQCGYPIIGSPL